MARVELRCSRLHVKKIDSLHYIYARSLATPGLSRVRSNGKKTKPMKQNKIFTINAATGVARSILAGITEVGAGVTLTYNPTADISTALNNVLTVRGNYDQAKSAKTILRETLAATVADVQTYVRGTRDLFKMRWGSEHTDRFAAIGFRDDFAVTDSIDDLQDRLQAIKSYFTANPTQEVTGLFTATQAQALLDALDAAKNALTIQEGEIAGLMTIRDEKFDLLRQRISGVYQELLMQLDPLDARWLTFGFNKPGADETPDKVEGLQVTLIGATAAAMKWGAAVRAAYYRVWYRIHGTTGEYIAAGSPADLDFTIENLPAASAIDIVVTAVNTGGESPLSEVVTITTH
jgi:hypothetical protein